MQKNPLRLYSTPSCGYCRLVKNEAERLGITLEIVDVSRDENARRKLIDRRGRATVPVLGFSIGDQEILLAESREIIKYLRGAVPRSVA